MTKAKKTTDTNTTVEPRTVTKVDIPKVQPEASVQVPPGHVWIVDVDENGNEVGKGFFYPEKSYKRFYSDETKFRVKKKAN